VSTTVYEVSFKDLGFSATLEANKKYYLNINLFISAGSGPVDVQIILKKSSTTSEITQTLKTIEVSNTSTRYELSFTPNTQYDLLVF